MSSTRLTRYFLRLGTTGFGGPPALVSRMHADLVEDRGWFDEKTYREGLALAQLAPGPLAAQLAIYLGWAEDGIRGATKAGIAFIAPSLCMVLALSVFYRQYNGLPWVARAFHGIAPVVIAIVLRGSIRLSRKSLEKNALLWTLFAVNAVATAIASKEIVWLILLSACVCVIHRARTPPPSLDSTPPAPVKLRVPASAALAITGSAKLFLFFAKASMLVFGSGLAVIPFLYGGVVTEHAWLTPSQFLDAIAVSMITPGPVVITVAFIGYMVGGFPGAMAAALGMFLPTYAAVLVFAPIFAQLKQRPAITAFVDGLTAAATGAIAGSVVVLAERVILNGTGLLIAAAVTLLLSMKRSPPEPLVIVIAGAVGIIT